MQEIDIGTRLIYLNINKLKREHGNPMLGNAALVTFEPYSQLQLLIFPSVHLHLFLKITFHANKSAFTPQHNFFK